MLDFDFADVADSSYDEDGFLEIGLGHCGPIEKAGGSKATFCYPFGLDARPLDPEGEAHCDALWWRDGDRQNAMPMTDARVVKKLPKLRKGGSRLYCAAGSFLMFDGEDPDGKVRSGSLTVSVKYPGKSHLLSMGMRTAGKEEVSLKHGEGMGLAMTAGGKRSALLRNAKGTAYFETNDDGNIINGKTKVTALVVGQAAAAKPVASAVGVLAALQAMAAAGGLASASMTTALQSVAAAIPVTSLSAT